ncbi:MAG: SIMPL domain-containing protein [Candidatus Micrarchaeota archaeon]|nr:SIMPL domain-containing protein [Candidatus Micrarchaeota archaeon]
MPKENHDRGFVYVAALAIIVLGIVAFSAREVSLNGSGMTKGSVILVGASGIAYDTPAEATMYLLVNGTGNSTAAATANVSTTLAAVNKTISGYINGNTTYISTTGYSSYRIYNSTNYAVYENLAVTVPNITNIGSAISGVSQIPNVYVSSVQPMLSDQQLSVMRADALWRALQNATVQAQVLAGPGSQIKQTNITVNTYSVVPYPAYANSFAVAGGTSKAAAQTYYGGRSKLVESVSVTFTYQRGCGCA